MQTLRLRWKTGFALAALANAGPMALAQTDLQPFLAPAIDAGRAAQPAQPTADDARALPPTLSKVLALNARIAQSISPAALRRAFAFFDAHPARFNNREFVGIADYTKSSLDERFFVINTRDGTLHRYVVSHGKRSGLEYATHFSNEHGSYATSVGAFVTLDTRYSKKFRGTVLTVHGLQRSNWRALARGLLMHPRDYVAETNGGQFRARSEGCFAFLHQDIDEIVGYLRGGALLYSYGVEGGTRR